MKKLLFFFGMIAILNISCEKDDDDKKTYAQEKLIGTWESEKDEDGCVTTAVFTVTEMSQKTMCEGSIGSGGFTTEYSFDGKQISTEKVNFPYVINELTETTLVLDILGVETKYVKVK